MANDRIEHEIVIAQPVERVWAVLTDVGFLGGWFGNGEPVEMDLRPGGRILFDHGAHGSLPAVLEQVAAPSELSFRWSQGDAGTDPTPGNSTLVEFKVSEESSDASRLRTVESGFATLEFPEETRTNRYDINNAGWVRKLEELRDYAEGSR